MGRNFVALLPYYWSFFSVVVMAIYGSSSKILSVTRSKDKGDSFEVDFESYGCPSCEQYGAVSSQANGGTSSGCSCQCSETKPTFYRSHSGQHGCVKDRDVLADTQGGNICDFYTGNAQQLQALDLHVGGSARLKPDGFCEQVQIAGWKFYFNTSWILSSSTTFYTISSNKGNNTGKLQTFLFWNDYLDSFYKGLLIKVMILCTYRGITDDRCLMLKAQGTHQYFEIPTTTAPVYDQTSSTSPTTEKNKNIQKSTVGLVESTDSNSVPTGGYSKASDKQIWIAVSLGLAGLVLIIVIVITVFLWLKCRRNCKQERTGSLHHPAEQPAISAVCSPLHDYEYVHYPCLVEGARTPPVIPRGNPMYERGEDNKLIIWTPGHSGTLTRHNSQSAEAAAPRLPYQRLLTRTSSSSPDCSATIGPLSPPSVEEGFPYQKLVRSVPSLLRDDQGCGCAEELAAVSSTGMEKGCPYQKLSRVVPSLRREEQACGHTEEATTGLAEEGASSKAYQTLSLQRNPLYSLKECEGYAEVNIASRPESSSEYDYARVSVELDPVELNKLFRISHSETEEMPRSSMEISIGDLNNTASNTNTDQKRHSGISKTSSTSSCSGDYENCTCKTVTKRDSQSSVNRDDECVKSKDLRPAASYEDLSGGCRLYPEEYVEMGKRKSTMFVESRDPSDTEDGGHEYFVLEGVVESCEGETVDVY